MKGIYDKGNIKKTNNQIKKHHSQMIDSELNLLISKILQIDTNKITLSKHCLNNNVEFSVDEIHQCLTNIQVGNIIEYNEVYRENTIDRRVLIRSSLIHMTVFNEYQSNEFKGKANLCFVVSLCSFEIITTYFNLISDNHTGLRMDRYDKNLKIKF